MLQDQTVIEIQDGGCHKGRFFRSEIKTAKERVECERLNPLFIIGILHVTKE